MGYKIVIATRGIHFPKTLLWFLVTLRRKSKGHIHWGIWALGIWALLPLHVLTQLPPWWPHAGGGWGGGGCLFVIQDSSHIFHWQRSLPWPALPHVSALSFICRHSVLSMWPWSLPEVTLLLTGWFSVSLLQCKLQEGRGPAHLFIVVCPALRKGPGTP